MTAAVIPCHGGPEVLEVREFERPRPKPGEVRLKVSACALNAFDVFVRQGLPGVPVELPHISGGDIVGVVEAAGDAEGEGFIGQTALLDPNLEAPHMLGETDKGGLAEYVVAPVGNLIAIPQDDDVKKYAALPVAYGTAHRMLKRAGLQPGETLAVLGAAGGVGVACVQLGKRLGARVIACSSSQAKLDRLAQLGADELVDTSKSDYGAEIWKLTGKQGADVVVDYLGRDTLSKSVRATRRFGRIAICGATTGFEAVVDLRFLWVREITIVGSNGWERRDLEELVALVADGSLDPVIHEVHPLSRAADAYADVEERRAFGKVVVVPDSLSRP